jgi:hypothetical protein
MTAETKRQLATWTPGMLFLIAGLNLGCYLCGYIQSKTHGGNANVWIINLLIGIILLLGAFFQTAVFSKQHHRSAKEF